MHASYLFAAVAVIVCVTSPLFAQKDKGKDKKPAGPLLTRSMVRQETIRLPFGGSVTFTGAPVGSVVIEGWQRSELSLEATLEWQAPTAAGLDLVSSVNNFVVDEDLNHIRIMTTGTHDPVLMKRVAKGFPKELIGMPWKIDFKIKVPAMTGLVVDAGIGPIKLSGVEGKLQLNALSSEADLTLTGGLVSVLIQNGKMNLKIPSRNWRGLSAEFKMAAGALNVELAPGFSGEINADVLRTGEVKGNYPDLQPRDRNGITPKSIRVRAGNGGATLNFLIGDGAIQINQSGESSQR
jgi:hypothetical protein